MRIKNTSSVGRLCLVVLLGLLVGCHRPVTSPAGRAGGETPGQPTIAQPGTDSVQTLSELSGASPDQATPTSAAKWVPSERRWREYLSGDARSHDVEAQRGVHDQISLSYTVYAQDFQSAPPSLEAWLKACPLWYIPVRADGTPRRVIDLATGQLLMPGDLGFQVLNANEMRCDFQPTDPQASLHSSNWDLAQLADIPYLVPSARAEACVNTLLGKFIRLMGRLPENHDELLRALELQLGALRPDQPLLDPTSQDGIRVELNRERTQIRSSVFSYGDAAIQLINFHIDQESGQVTSDHVQLQAGDSRITEPGFELFLEARVP